MKGETKRKRMLDRQIDKQTNNPTNKENQREIELIGYIYRDLDERKIDG